MAEEIDVTLRWFASPASKSKVILGQSCYIGARGRYAALSWSPLGRDKEGFVILVPEDIGIFLGYSVRTLWSGPQAKRVYNEVAVFPRKGFVVCAEGVLESPKPEHGQQVLSESNKGK